MPRCPCGSKVAPEGMDDIVRDRKCTDLLWLVFFAFFWVGMLVIAIIGMQNGNPAKLLYGKDYTDAVCSGTKKYVHYPRINEDLYGIVTSGEIDPYSMSFYGICLPECPKAGEWNCDNTYQGAERPTDDALETCLSKTILGGGAFLYQDPGLAASPLCKAYMKHCWKSDMDTRSLFYRCLPAYNETSTTVELCENPPNIPADNEACTKKKVTKTTNTVQPGKKNPVFEQLNSVAGEFLRYFADLQKAQWAIIVSGICGGLVFGFLWLMLLRYTAHIVVWLTVFMFVALCAAITLFSYSKAGIIGQNDMAAIVGSDSSMQAYSSATESSSNAWKYIAYAMTAMTVVAFLVVVLLRKKIGIAIGVIKEASKAVARIKSLLLFPIVTIISLTALAIWFLSISMYLMSAESFSLNLGGGGTEPNITASSNATGFNVTSPSTLDLSGFDNTFHYLMAYHFFGLLWTTQFNQSFGIMCISGAVASWYFAGPHDGDNKNEDDDIQSKLGNAPLFSSVMRTSLYHMGTICAGSFMIAFIQFLRAVMAYIESKTKDLQGKNRFLKCIMKLVQCILYCFEKIVKYISRLAFIQTAIKGTNFCTSAIASMKLMFKEAALVGIITAITDIMMSLGKGVISMFTGLIAFIWLQYGFTDAETRPSSTALPVLITMMFGFAIGTACLEVYETAIDTILLCFCMDKELNESNGNMKAGAHLQDFVKKSAKKAAALDGKTDGDASESKGKPKKKKAAAKKKQVKARAPKKVEASDDFI